MKLLKFIPIGIAALALAFTSCKKPQEEKDATAISIDKTTVTLTADEPAVELRATLTPSDATSTITWTSSDPAIVSVEGTGKTAIVSALSKGKVTITAKTSNNLTATCEVISEHEANPGEVVPNLPPPGAGKVTVAIRVPKSSCEYGIIMTGVGFGVDGADDWDPGVEPNNPFTKVDGTETWYQITVPYIATLAGKPCAVPQSGATSWSYQWGKNGKHLGGDNVDNITILPQSTGGAAFELENDEEGTNPGEPKLISLTDNSVVYIDIKAWQTDPCGEVNPAGTATFSVTANPAFPEGTAVGVTGAFATNSWSLDNPVVLTLEGGAYTGTAEVTAGFQYKYVYKLPGQAGFVWENSGNRIMPTNNITSGDVIEWDGVTPDPFTPETAKISLIGNAFHYIGTDSASKVANWDFDIDFTFGATTDGVSTYTVNNVALVAAGEFKLRLDHAWTTSWGFAAANVEGDTENIVAAADAANTNFVVVANKTYNITFSINWTDKIWKVRFTPVP